MDASFFRFKNALLKLIKEYKRVKRENKRCHQRIQELNKELAYLREANLKLKQELDSLRLQRGLPFEEYESVIEQLNQYIADIDFCLTLISQKQLESNGESG
jgi:chromosome segregation ATPase